jgi:hypothetical protein
MPTTIFDKDAITHDHGAVSGFLLFSLLIVLLLFGPSFIDIPVATAITNEMPVIGKPTQPETLRPEVEPAAPVPQQAPEETLTPRMRAVLEHVAQRYRVSAEALHPIFQAAQRTGRERDVDPLLIVAVIGIESRFNPFSESAMGALGLMQVMPRFHQDKLPFGAERSFFLDPISNVLVGTHILQESIRRNGELIAGLQQFGGAVNDETQSYANKVLAEKERLEQAAGKNNRP